MRRALSRVYGAGAGHLLATLAALALAGAVLPRLFDSGPASSVALWLGGAIVAHDFVLYPVYALADRAAVAAGRRAAARRRWPNPVNYLRLPTLFSALTFLAAFPLILGVADGYPGAAGRDADPYLGRWLALSGGAFAASALLYAAAALRLRARGPEGQSPA